MKITIEQLRKRIPCQEEFDTIAKHWPDGVEATQHNLYKLYNTNCGGNTQTICDLIDLVDTDKKEEFLKEYEKQLTMYHESCDRSEKSYLRNLNDCEHEKDRETRRYFLNRLHQSMQREADLLLELFQAEVTEALAKALNSQEESYG